MTADKRLEVDQPILTNADLAKIRSVEAALAQLRERGVIYDDDGALVNPSQYIQAKDAYRMTSHELRIASPAEDRLRFDPAVNLVRTGDDEKDIVTNTQLFTKITEDYVRRYPDQWLWIHKRWKTRPPGEPDIYS